jgi:hypothetical protein
LLLCSGSRRIGNYHYKAKLFYGHKHNSQAFATKNRFFHVQPFLGHALSQDAEAFDGLYIAPRLAARKYKFIGKTMSRQ